MRHASLSALIALTSCSGAMRTAGAPPLGSTAETAHANTQRDYVAPLERAGVVPVDVSVYTADFLPAANVTLMAVDSAERVVYFSTDELGRARIQLWSASIPVWRAKTPEGAWVAIAGARIYPSDTGDGWRAVVTLVPLPGQEGK